MLTICLKKNGLRAEVIHMSSKCTLDQINPGSSVEVKSLSESNPHLYRRLLSMGVVAGHVLTVLGRAPLGDPISISTLGYTLSLRLAEARVVEVIPVA